MEIAPTSTVKLYSGIPLENTYTDTLYFATLADQSSYFSGLTPVKVFNSQMYQRVNKGIFEASCRADDIYNCNYMAFQNTGFGNKWFYAFITKIEYINNHNCQVFFEIDVMQTWMFDCTLEHCFIERQHSAGDNIGSNILPEPVEVGEYVYDVNNGQYDTTNPYDRLFPSLESQAILIMSSEPYPSDGWTWGNRFDNVYSGCYLYAVRATSNHADTNIRQMINNFIEKPEVILAMYMCPLNLLPIPDNETIEWYDYLHPVPDNKTASTLNYIGDAPASDDSFGGYTPRNKKLYTYPYNFFQVDDGNGSNLKLRYEFFNNHRPQLLVQGCITNPVQIRLTPYNYRGTTHVLDSGTLNEHQVECRTEFLTIANYPMCSWNYDTYRAWVAQNSIPIILQSGASALSALTSKGFKGLVGASGINLTADLLSREYKASLMGDTCKGNISSGNVNFASNRQQFYGGRCHITMDYAIMIDKFFDMYGYAYNQIGIPNTHSRPHWNYVKTIGAKIIGQCPCDDLNKMCQIYDNGITFWKNASEVGHYQLDNSPT